MPARGLAGRFAASGGPVRQIFLGDKGLFSSVSVGGNGQLQNEFGLVDGTFINPAVLSVFGNSSASNLVQLVYSGFSKFTVAPAAPAFVFNAMFDVPTNSLNGGGSDALAEVLFSWNDSGGGHQVVLASAEAGVTVPKTTASASVPANASNLQIFCSVQTRVADSAGVLVLQVYETWITF